MYYVCTQDILTWHYASSTDKDKSVNISFNSTSGMSQSGSNENDCFCVIGPKVKVSSLVLLSLGTNSGTNFGTLSKNADSGWNQSSYSQLHDWESMETYRNPKKMYRTGQDRNTEIFLLVVEIEKNG